MSDRNEFISAIDLAAKHGSEIAICIDASFNRLPIEQGCIQDLWEQRLESLINEPLIQ